VNGHRDLVHAMGENLRSETEPVVAYHRHAKSCTCVDPSWREKHERACHVLALLADAGAQEPLVDAGAPEAIMAALTHPTCEAHSDAELQDAGCSALWSMALDCPVARAACVECGAAPVAVSALREHPRNVRVRESAAGLLWSLVADADADAVLTVAASGAVHAAVDVLHWCSGDAAAHVQALGALWSFSAVTQVCAVAVDAGAVAAVTRAMSKAPASASSLVQKHGCAVLWNLACQRGAAAVVDSVDSSGVVDAVVGALWHHGSHSGVAETACGALRSVAAAIPRGGQCHGHPDGEPSSRAGAVQAVLHAMRLHPSDAAVQQQGCGALGELCDGGLPIGAPGTSAAVAVVVDAMRRLADDAEVQLAACTALRSLLHGARSGSRASSTSSSDSESEVSDSARAVGVGAAVADSRPDRDAMTWRCTLTTVEGVVRTVQQRHCGHPRVSQLATSVLCTLPIL
jgi:hypothetical protein